MHTQLSSDCKRTFGILQSRFKEHEKYTLRGHSFNVSKLRRSLLETLQRCAYAMDLEINAGELFHVKRDGALRLQFLPRQQRADVNGA